MKKTPQTAAERELTRLPSKDVAALHLAAGDLITDPEGERHLVTDWCSIPGNIVSFTTDTGLQLDKTWYEARVDEYATEQLDPSVTRGFLFPVGGADAPRLIELGRDPSQQATALAEHLGTTDLVTTKPLRHVQLWQPRTTSGEHRPVNAHATAAQRQLWSAVTNGDLAVADRTGLARASAELAKSTADTSVFGPALLLNAPQSTGGLRSLSWSIYQLLRDAIAC